MNFFIILSIVVLCLALGDAAEKYKPNDVGLVESLHRRIRRFSPHRRTMEVPGRLPVAPTNTTTTSPTNPVGPIDSASAQFYQTPVPAAPVISDGGMGGFAFPDMSSIPGAKDLIGPSTVPDSSSFSAGFGPGPAFPASNSAGPGPVPSTYQGPQANPGTQTKLGSRNPWSDRTSSSKYNYMRAKGQQGTIVAPVVEVVPEEARITPILQCIDCTKTPEGGAVLGGGAVPGGGAGPEGAAPAAPAILTSDKLTEGESEKLDKEFEAYMPSDVQHQSVVSAIDDENSQMIQKYMSF